MDATAPPVVTTSENAQQSTVSSFYSIGRVVVILVSYVFIFLGFLCQLGGVGKSNKKCNDDNDSDFCTDTFRYDWWTIFFQVLVALGVAVTLITNTLKEVSMGVSILMAVSITQMIITAEKYLDLRERGSSYKAAAAGYILATMGDMLLALVMGVSEVPTVQMVDTTKIRTMVQGFQIWPQRHQPQHPQHQAEMAAQMEAQMGGQMGVQMGAQMGMQQGQGGSQLGTQPPVGHYQQTPDQPTRDPYTPPIGGDRVPMQTQQPSPQQRLQNLAPHYQGQQQQYGSPPSVPPPVPSPKQPTYMQNP